MKKLDYIVAFSLILLGASCLAMSGTVNVQNRFSVFVEDFTTICIWLATPAIVIGILYLIRMRRNKNENN